MSDKSGFTFFISLSVLNDLGRKLYRSFSTVLGEAISNSWDADANNVWIYIDKSENTLIIKDDGDGMSAQDFQNKFLKIGYSKRREGKNRSVKGRPYIGRKGIGKLALLSCSDRVSVLSKTKDGQYVGGVIDNARLDQAIAEDLEAQKYALGRVDLDEYTWYTKNHEKGTIIYFENMKDGIRNSLPNIRKLIALYFKFSLIDNSFNIFVDDEQITVDDLEDLAKRTEFLWIINKLKDPYVTKELKFREKNLKKDMNLIKPGKDLSIKEGITGFIASVRKPADLKIFGTDEKVGIDLLVNGRLRERNIMLHIPTARVTESYLYGQIHFDGLDDERDRFSTSREGIVADDEKFKQLLETLSEVVASIMKDWDDWRREHHKEGDSENPAITKKERKSEELFNVVSDEYRVTEVEGKPEIREEVDRWVDELANDATYNFSSYADCFVSENLVRKHIEEKKVAFSEEARREIELRKTNESASKNKGNVSIEIRRAPSEVSYLSMDDLANLVDKAGDPIKQAALSRDAAEYKPMRDALMHTALLTVEAKTKLTTVFQNIRARVKSLLDAG